jgi:hypothetical protein
LDAACVAGEAPAVAMENNDRAVEQIVGACRWGYPRGGWGDRVSRHTGNASTTPRGLGA